MNVSMLEKFALFFCSFVAFVLSAMSVYSFDDFPLAMLLFTFGFLIFFVADQLKT